MVFQGADRVGAVLDEVVGDHEVLRAVRERAQRLAVIHSVHARQGQGGEFGVLAP